MRGWRDIGRASRADMVNALPKYVWSTTLSGALEWNATLLEGKLGDSIPALEDDIDGDLFLHGSGAYALAEKGLIDEYEVYLNPLVWARETSMFSATGPSDCSSPTSSGFSPECPPHLPPGGLNPAVPRGGGRPVSGCG
jgi:hypothetical protein